MLKLYLNKVATPLLYEKNKTHPTNFPLNTDFTAVYWRKKARLLLYTVDWQLCVGCHNIQQKLQKTWNPVFTKTSTAYNSETYFKETGLDMLQRCLRISKVHIIRTIYRNMAAGWIRITDCNAWNGDYSNSTRWEKQIKEARGIQKDRTTETETRKKHWSYSTFSSWWDGTGTVLLFASLHYEQVRKFLDNKPGNKI